MIEIFILWQLCKSVGAVARKKGHTAIGYQILTVVLWFGCEIAGLVMGLIVTEGGRHANDGFNFGAYIFGLVGAAIGAAISFAIVNSLQPVRGGDEYYRPTEQDPFKPSDPEQWPGTEGDYRSGGDNPYRK
jgi:hypothetical protein